VSDHRRCSSRGDGWRGILGFSDSASGFPAAERSRGSTRGVQSGLRRVYKPNGLPLLHADWPIPPTRDSVSALGWRYGARSQVRPGLCHVDLPSRVGVRGGVGVLSPDERGTELVERSGRARSRALGVCSCAGLACRHR